MWILSLQLFVFAQLVLSISSRTSECQICIGEHFCSDDTIYFSTFISENCVSPLPTRFSFDTDVTTGRTFFNWTIDCIDCFTNITVDAVKDAWDYTLRLESPSYEGSSNCSVAKTARCGGAASKLVLYTAAGLSGLFILFGASVCGVKTYRRFRRDQNEKKRVEEAVIN